MRPYISRGVLTNCQKGVNHVQRGRRTTTTTTTTTLFWPLRPVVATSNHLWQENQKSVIRHLQAKPVNNELAITKSKLNLHKSFDTKKVKVAHTRLPSVVFRSWSRFFAVSLPVTWVTNPAVGCHYFPTVTPTTVKKGPTAFKSSTLTTLTICSALTELFSWHQRKHQQFTFWIWQAYSVVPNFALHV